MRVTRYRDAPRYEAPNHRDVTSMRLQSFSESSAGLVWTGVSHFRPGGGAGPDASGVEKIYVVLGGAMTVIVDGCETVLGELDSCLIPKNVTREIVNRGDHVCIMMVLMPTVAASA